MNLSFRCKRLARPVFIIYSQKDSAVVDPVVSALLASRFCCWQDKRALRPIDNFDDEIKAAIRRSLVVLVFASVHSLESKWVLEEAEYAVAQRKRVLMIKLDESPLPAQLSALKRLQWIEIQKHSAVVPSLLGTLRRLRNKLRIVWAARVASLTALVVLVWTYLLPVDKTAVEVVVESELLPATVYCDGERIHTLTLDLPRRTIDVMGMRHIIHVKHGLLTAERRISKYDGDTAFVFFSKEEFQ